MNDRPFNTVYNTIAQICSLIARNHHSQGYVISLMHTAAAVYLIYLHIVTLELFVLNMTLTMSSINIKHIVKTQENTSQIYFNILNLFIWFKKKIILTIFSIYLHKKKCYWMQIDLMSNAFSLIIAFWGTYCVLMV